MRSCFDLYISVSFRSWKVIWSSRKTKRYSSSTLYNYRTWLHSYKLHNCIKLFSCLKFYFRSSSLNERTCNLWEFIIWVASSENVPSRMRKMCGYSSTCACATSHPRLCFPLIHSMVSNDSCSGQRRPWSDCAGRADWSRPSLSAYAQRHIFLLRGPMLINHFSEIYFQRKWRNLDNITKLSKSVSIKLNLKPFGIPTRCPVQ